MLTPSPQGVTQLLLAWSQGDAESLEVKRAAERFCFNPAARFQPDGAIGGIASLDSLAVRKIQISSEGGTDPLWSQKGEEIFYRNADKMMVVPVSLAGGFKAGKPPLLWERHYWHGMSSSCGPPGVSSGNYCITADGQQFLMVKDNDQDVVSNKLVVILNWTRTLEGLTGGK